MKRYRCNLTNLTVTAIQCNPDNFNECRAFIKGSNKELYWLFQAWPHLIDRTIMGWLVRPSFSNDLEYYSQAAFTERFTEITDEI